MCKMASKAAVFVKKTAKEPRTPERALSSAQPRRDAGKEGLSAGEGDATSGHNTGETEMPGATPATQSLRRMTLVRGWESQARSRGRLMTLLS